MWRTKYIAGSPCEPWPAVDGRYTCTCSRLKTSEHSRHKQVRRHIIVFWPRLAPGISTLSLFSVWVGYLKHYKQPDALYTYYAHITYFRLTCAHTHTHTRTCAHARTHAHTHARTHVHTHARTHVHTHARTHVHTHTHAHTYTHTHTHTRTHTHTQVRWKGCMQVNIFDFFGCIWEVHGD